MTGKAHTAAVGRFAIIAVTALAFVAAAASAASADIALLDPKTVVDVDLYQKWANTATGWAQHIYLTLLVFELIALAVTTLLFRENIGEFFSSFGLKVLIGGVYFWFIDNVATGVGWPMAIIAMFKNFGIQLGGTDSTDWLTAQGLAAATAYGLAGSKAQFLGAQAAALANAPPNCTWVYGGVGYCNTGIVTGIATESAPFAMMMYGMALMIVMAIAAIYLQIILMTIESYMVVGAGVLFIGFAGSRFTMPFSQGYFSYMFNVGVKFMVLYIVLGIEQQFMPQILGSAIAALLLTTPYTEYLAFVPAAVGLVNVVIAAGLVWTIPGFAGSFLSGQSAASGSAVLGQALGAMSSASGMVAQMHQAKNTTNAADKSSAPLRTGHASSAAGANDASGSTAHHGDSQMSPAAQAQSLQPNTDNVTTRSALSFGPQGSLHNAAATFGSQPSTTSFNGGLPGGIQTSFQGGTPSLPGLSLGLGPGQSPNSGGHLQSPSPPPDGGPTSAYGMSTLDQRTPAQISDMHDNFPQQYRKEFNATDPRNLTQSQVSLLTSPGFIKETTAMEKDRTEDARRSAELLRAGALNSLAQGAPRDIGQPSAVQVRLANPDKL